MCDVVGLADLARAEAALDAAAAGTPAAGDPALRLLAALAADVATG